MADTSICLRLVMLSDWRVGTGTGRQGAIDGLVARDVHNLPFVPATTLRGIWRDAAEQLAFGLDDGLPDGPWMALARRLFGGQPAIERQAGIHVDGPVPALLRTADARFPDQLGAYLSERKKHAAIEAFAFVKSGVAIDPVTGRAKDDHLRFDEISRAGAVLAAECALRATGDAAFDRAAEQFALAALRLVERLGGDRRRGSGQCVVEVDGAAGGQNRIDAAIDWLAENPDAPDCPPWASAATATDHKAQGVGSGSFRRLAVEVELTAPTTIASKVEGNLISTQNMIPGTMLVAALSELLIDKAGMKADLFSTALADGRIRCLPAYPAIGPMRGLPAPFDLEEKKDDQKGPSIGEKRRGKIRRRPVDCDTCETGKSATSGGTCEIDTAQYKALRADFCLPALRSGVGLAKGIALAEKPKPRLRTHNAVDDQRQKPINDAGGGVYVAEAMQPGTILRAELAIDAGLLDAGALDAGAFDKPAVSSTTAHFGRARMAGYGAARVTIGAEVAPPKSGPAASVPDHHVIWLTSDLILPIGDGTPIERIAGLLGVGVDAIDKCRSDLRFHRIDGWIGAWGLPRPTLTAVAAGSVITLKTADPAIGDHLAKLQQTGIGLRRGEGFGDFLLNAEVCTASDTALNPDAVREPSVEPKEPKVALPPLSPALRACIDRIEHAALRKVLQDLAELAADRENRAPDELGWTAKKPGMAQLGNIRALIDPTADDPDLSAALAWVNKLASVDRRANAFGGKDRLEKLAGLLTIDAKDATAARIWGLLTAAVAGDDKGDAKKTEDPLTTELKRATIVAEPGDVRKNPAMARKATAMFLAALMRLYKRGGETSSAGASEKEV